MKNITRYIVALSSLSFVFAFVYEGRTNLGANIESNRALMETRVRLSQTSNGAVSEEAVDANMSALDSYNQTLKAEYALFGCNAETPCR